MEKSLSIYHPIVSFSYFILVIGATMLFMHPIFILISFFSALLYSFLLKKERTLQTLKFTLLMSSCITIANALFVNRGVTVLFYLRDNPVTLESITYGILSGIMMSSVIMWFSCYNEIITSDKFLYIFGKITPHIALMVNMTLRLIPKLTEQTKIIANTQKTIGLDYQEGSLKNKVKSSMRILSILVTWSLEDAVETADSMKARGYGIKGRSSFNIYKFVERDTIMILMIGIIGVFLMVGYFYGYSEMIFYPTISAIKFDILSVSLYLSFLLITMLPIFLEIVEEYKWRY